MLSNLQHPILAVLGSMLVSSDPKQVQDAWIPLPYEIASAAVRTLVLHIRKLEAARAAFQLLYEKDPTKSKPKTVSTEQEVKLLESGQRHIVMNRRTGQIASAEWLYRHVHIVEGIPTPRNAKTRMCGAGLVAGQWGSVQDATVLSDVWWRAG